MVSLPLLFQALLSTCLCAILDVRAQDRTNEAYEASITDPNVECQPYTDPLVTSILPNFPAIWVPATLLPNDMAGQAKWNSIMSTIPTNIQVKGSITGDFSNTTPTYNPSDPDCWWSYSTCTTPKLAGLHPDIINMPEPNTLGYGFDDGPNCSHNAFYDFLQSQNQKATMYYIGSNVMDWPSEAQRAVADGHEICAHTWSHHYMTAFSSQDAFAELYYSVQAIKAVTGVTPTCWRPPFGDVDDRIRAIASGLGLRTIIWEHDTFDWEQATGNVTAAQVDTNYGNVIQLAQNGSLSSRGTIVLFHELNNFTMSEAIKFYPQLKAAYKFITPVGVGYNITQPYVEVNYSQPTFSQYTSGTVNTTIMSSSATPAQPTDPPHLNAAKQLSALQRGGALILLAVILVASLL